MTKRKIEYDSDGKPLPWRDPGSGFHIIGCPCESCAASKKMLDDFGRWFDEMKADPVRYAEWQAKVKERFAKARQQRPKKSRPRCCCPCHERY